MHPFLKDGDVVTISPIRDGHLSLGDIIAFCQPETEKLAVHRLVRKLPERYLVRGDNAPHPDGLISMEEILGLVTRVERHGRKIRFGRGAEKRVLAFFSRRSLLQPLVFRIRGLYRLTSMGRLWNRNKPQH